MQTFDTQAIQIKFAELFDSAKNEMFKAELLQDYTPIDDSPSLRAWLRNDRKLAKKLGAEDSTWTNNRDKCLASPAVITRVHVVDEPYTPYLEWEIEVLYRDRLVKYGAEKVFLAPAFKLRNVDLPAGDFWIFDNKQVLELGLDSNGNSDGGTVWDELDDISSFLNLRQNILAAAKPLS